MKSYYHYELVSSKVLISNKYKITLTISFCYQHVYTVCILKLKLKTHWKKFKCIITITKII